MKCVKFSNIINLETVNSTNSYIKNDPDHFPDGTVVFAQEQTSGRGRLDRKWIGEKNKSIFVSFLIKNIYDNADAIRLSFLFSIALKTFFSKYVDYSSIKLKWPNDILINGKKICGILSEYTKDCVIVGLGINLFDFAPAQKISKPWTSLSSETSQTLCMEILQSELVSSINDVFVRYCTNFASDIPMIWFRESGIIGDKISIYDGKKLLKGTVKMINDTGALIIQEENTKKNITVYYGDLD
ncbi:MAG: biotin--[acetyl-CoA-carboxylase] ligase [Candidatus Delongbacteria bacterium]